METSVILFLALTLILTGLFMSVVALSALRTMSNRPISGLVLFIFSAGGAGYIFYAAFYLIFTGEMLDDFYSSLLLNIDPRICCHLV